MATLDLTNYNVFFLDEESLKEQTMIREDVDMAVLTPTIKLCQDYYLYKLLGSNLFTDIANKIKSGTLSQIELTLLVVYIRPTLAWACMKMAPIFLSHKYTNRGVVQMAGTDSQPSSTSDLQMLGDMANQYYQVYADRLVMYLIANAPSFPAYRQMTAYNDVFPATNGWNPRISLGNKPKKPYMQHEIGGTNSVNLTSAMIAYFNVSKIITAYSHTSNTANFSGSFLPAPATLPGTSKSNFTFYDNSTLIPTAAVVSFTDYGNGTCSLVVDTTILGYSFQPLDIINSSGKYQ